MEQWYCLQASGHPPSRDAFLQRYSELADELRDCLDGLEMLQGEAGRFRDANASEPAPSRDETPCSPIRELGDFRIVCELGRGGMGIVYEVEQRSLNRRMALKVLPFAAVLDKHHLKRFQNEVRAAATLDHPNIVAVHSVGEERGVYYYAMQLIRGQNLAEIIRYLSGDKDEEHEAQDVSETKTSDTLPFAYLSTQRSRHPHEAYRTAARLIADAAKALDYAHNQGVVHRDIKPANLLVDEDLQVFVADFGLARLESGENITLTGDMLGTLRYMSPEQANGQQGLVDGRADIHALGATLYELLALRPAFEGENRGELLRRIANDAPRSLRSMDPRIPADLVTILEKSLEKDPADRYQSAGQMASDLEAFLEDRQISARPPSLATKVQKWMRRNARATIATGLVLVLTTLGLIVSSILIRHQRELAVRNAKKADDNFQLARSALEHTLFQSVAGELVVEYDDPKHSELRQRGIRFYEDLAHQNGVLPTTWTTYNLLICDQHLSRAYSLRRDAADDAMQAFEQAVDMAKELSVERSAQPHGKAKLIHCLHEYAVFLHDHGKADASRRCQAEARVLLQQLIAENPGYAPTHYLLALNHYNEGKWNQDAGQLIDAERQYREALSHLETAVANEPNEIRNPHLKAMCLYNLGLAQGTRGQFVAAKQSWQESVELWKGLSLVRPNVSEFFSRAGATLNNLAVLAAGVPEFEQCQQLAEQAITFQKRALEIEPAYEYANQFLAMHYKQLGLALSGLGKREALAELSQERVAYLPEVPGEYCAAAISLAECLSQLHADASDQATDRDNLMEGYARNALGLLAHASRQFGESAAVYQIADAYLTVADEVATTGRLDEARASWQSAVDLFRRLQSADAEESGLSKFQSQFGAALGNLAVLARLDGDYEACRTLATEAVNHQKHAMRIEPVHEAAREFLRKHYGELALALSALGECEPLAALAEQRIIDFSDEVAEYCEAAICLADCIKQCEEDGFGQNHEDKQLMDGYVRRSLEILHEATERCDSHQATLLVANAYIAVGDVLHELNRIEAARLVWESAQHELSRNVTSSKADEVPECAEHFEAIRQRLLAL
jgi:serine/threonine protein kinase/tetratricopeptide (TPR) repeat protein